MTPERIAQVIRSFERIAPRGQALATHFYDTLFRLAPDSRTLFKPDLGPQARKLVEMLAAIVDALHHPDRLEPMFRLLGERHAGYGVSEAHYDHVGAALLISLREVLGAGFDDETEAAWASLYAELAETMIAAQRAAAH